MKSTLYSVDQNVKQIGVYTKSDSPYDLFLPSPELDPFDSDTTWTSACDAHSVSGDSANHNNSAQESDACHTEVCTFKDSDFSVFEAGLISKIMHMTDIEVKAMQAGFEPEEVKTSAGEVTQTFRQRGLCLRDEKKNMELKKKSAGLQKQQQTVVV